MPKNKMLPLGILLIMVAFICNAFIVVSITPTVTASVTNPRIVPSHGQYYGIDDPVLSKIKDMTAKGSNNSTIVSELNKLGMFWDPKTGDHGIGKLLTPEEMAKLPSMQNPETMYATATSGLTPSSMGVTPMTTYTGTQANVFWKSNNMLYDEDLYNIVPGSLVISTSGTTNHCITSHMGGGSDWIEAGIRRDVQNGQLGPYTVFTYWGYGGSQAWYCPSGFSIGPDTVVGFALERSEPYDSQYNGYPYDFYVNNQWVRRVYMNYAANTVDWANEMWRASQSNNYDRDSSSAQMSEGVLHESSSGYWDAWASGFPDTYYVAPNPCPMTSSRSQYTDQYGTFWRWLSSATP